jgi:hypothetical protein
MLSLVVVLFATFNIACLCIYQANEDVTQIVEVLPPGPAKWTWLVKRLVEMTTCKYKNMHSFKIKLVNI